ncbi:hypothetical protein PEX1_020920 [Penicillium expansum]|nr:hypothetical protein PEXP_096740 [Penicillium expansum]KGO64217.1 hypothetical protein PEX1_020920 [Penicillium expansum]
MEEGDTWATLFFSGSPPDILQTSELDNKTFRPFCAEDDKWKLRSRVDIQRASDANAIQVFWLWINGHRKYIGKVFPTYTEEDAKIQLHRISVYPTPEMISNAMHEFDRFSREARAYSHIDLYCSSRERVYFPRFYGVVTDMPRSRLRSGYWHQRAVILEAIRSDLGSRRVLSQDVDLSRDIDQLPEGFLTTLERLSKRLWTITETMFLSPFEQEWYQSLLKDRLRRLNALHRVGITHGDIHDFHFRLPDDFYDTVLYDFSASYTFSETKPFRVNSGRPRPLSRISEGERERVLLSIQDRAASRDLRLYLTTSNSGTSVDNALWQPLDKEEGLLELIIIKVSHRPDGFSMPTLNSIFPFLEAVCPKSDLCWHIRRGRLLHHYKSVWAVSRDEETQPISFDCEREFRTIETTKDSRFMLCLVPNSWIISLKMNPDVSGHYDRLQQFCSSLISAESPGVVIGRGEFLKDAEITKTPI